MKTTPLTIRRCPDRVHQALKARARANHRSLNGEVLDVLEREAEQKHITGAQFAANLRKFWKMFTPREHREAAEATERGIELMRREHLH